METTSRNLIEALIGVVAIWLVVHNLPDYITGLFPFAAPSDDLSQPKSIRMILSVHLIGSISVGILLLLLRRRIAHWLARGNERVAASVGALTSVGTVLIAIFFLGSGLSQLVAHIITKFEFRDSGFSSFLDRHRLNSDWGSIAAHSALDSWAVVTSTQR